MDSVADAMGRSSSSRDDDRRFVTSNLVKRRRTKRRAAPATVVGPDSSVSSAEISSSTAVTEEDEDMANCLILLARGGATRTASDAYRCKTCSRCFPSFQALGGHRTSHKKPKTSVALLDAADETQVHQVAAAAGALIARPAATASSNDDAAAAAGNKPRVHECSICGAEFSSGQALGGHMRRHRPLTSPAGPQQIIKQDKTVMISLDLNLPAPADDDGELDNTTKPPAPVTFPFETRRPLVFSASSLDWSSSKKEVAELSWLLSSPPPRKSYGSGSHPMSLICLQSNLPPRTNCQSNKKKS